MTKNKDKDKIINIVELKENKKNISNEEILDNVKNTILKSTKEEIIYSFAFWLDSEDTLRMTQETNSDVSIFEILGILEVIKTFLMEGL